MNGPQGESWDAAVCAVRCDLAALRMRLALQKFAQISFGQKFSPDQPRVPAGQSGGGQWTDGGGAAGDPTRDGRTGDARRGGGLIQPVFFQGYAVEKAAEAAITLYLYMADRNSRDATAVLEFNAREFAPGSAQKDPAISVRQLSRDEVDTSCPRHGLVQSLTDQSADRVRREGNYWTDVVYGTRVHTAIKVEIDAMFDPNFRAEVSAIKSKDAYYGERGSVRVDVFENVGDGTVCVYDIKTGKSKLTPARMLEIATNVHSLYGGTKRLLVIETKPQ